MLSRTTTKNLFPRMIKYNHQHIIPTTKTLKEQKLKIFQHDLHKTYDKNTVTMVPSYNSPNYVHRSYNRLIPPSSPMVLSKRNYSSETAIKLNNQIWKSQQSMRFDLHQKTSTKLVVFDVQCLFSTKHFHLPAPIVCKVLSEYGVEIDIEHVRKYTDMMPHECIKCLLGDPKIKSEWVSKHDKEIDNQTLNQIVKRAIDGYVSNYDIKFNGVAQIIESKQLLSQHDIRIGINLSSFPYLPSSIMKRIGNRDQFPAIIFRNLWGISLCESFEIIKVSEGPLEIKEGKMLGCWTVGIYGRGQCDNNHIPYDPYASPWAGHYDEYARQTTKMCLQQYDPNYIIQGVWNLPDVIDDVNLRLSKNEYPCNLWLGIDPP